MESEVIIVKNDETGLNDALDLTTELARQHQLSKKDEIRLRLLAEELFGAVNAVTKEFSAKYWVDLDDDKARINLEAETSMDIEKKLNLVDMSTNGRNEASKGLMGRIFDIVEYIMFVPADTVTFDMAQLHASTNQMGCYAGGVSPEYIWSLEQYRNDVKTAYENNEAQEEWDELEKSIIANIADDVKVWVEGDSVRLLIEKNINQS